MLNLRVKSRKLIRIKSISSGRTYLHQRDRITGFGPNSFQKRPIKPKPNMKYSFEEAQCPGCFSLTSSSVIASTENLALNDRRPIESGMEFASV